MALDSRLEIRLLQKLILTPQLQQAIKLLQMPQIELSQSITNELMENPFLEEELSEDSFSAGQPENENTVSEAEPVDNQYEDAEAPLEKLMGISADDYFEERGFDGRDLGYFTPGNVDQPSFDNFLSKNGDDLQEHLIWQLRLTPATDRDKEIAEAVIGNLDENGYLQASDEEIAAIAGCTPEEAAKAVTLVQKFDPNGVGARSLKECLLLQLDALELRGTLVESLIQNNLEDLERRRYQQMARQYSCSTEDIMNAVRVIEKLEPKPGRNYSSASPVYITPDVYIVKTDTGYNIVLNDEGLPRLRLNNIYKKLFSQKGTLSKEEKSFIEEKLRSAVWLLKSLDQRNKTIYRVAECILTFQREFFDHGVRFLKPLNLRDVATELKMHESTISRATSNKYLSCGHGLFCLKYFFSSGITGGEGMVSSTSVKDLIKRLVSEEDPKKPLNDQDIVKLCQANKIEIARRTVAKYRKELNIAPQNRRKRYD
ncbi:MAG: RNA polymerase factor sigma-54 [Actinomycetota bacterium]|nr:RNA polymerase factor sigma-54 [Actinomycetota bacterium]